MGNSFADQVKAGDVHGWHVYVLDEEGGQFSKVGSAFVVAYRISGLQNGNPRKLSIARSWRFDSRSAARAVEASALNSAGRLRLKGRDWLECSAKVATGLVELAIDELGLRDNLK